ncbi:MAG TPA: T9SS type A sorting domain-containing protein [Saprospiraceae bacterium]
MRSIATFLSTFFLLVQVFGQNNSQSSVENYNDLLKAQVNMAEFHDPYAFNIKYDEMPHPTGKAKMRAYLRERKLEAQRQTPLKPGVTYQNRGVIPPPEILASFSGNSIITGTPLDNHLAVGPAEHVISTINTHMLVTNNVGFWLGSYKLDEFFASTGGLINRFFDPRVIYDPQQDRFIMVIMNGSECADSEIALAFSQTNDPEGIWNLYDIDGCLNDDGTFADYPMISITDTDLFLTYNAVNADSSWQTGFFGTQIHQIDKMTGYNGETLSRKVWKDITYNGRLLRNICPVRNADEELPSSMYFLSNRNFDISNDTVFLLHLTGQVDDPDAELAMTHRILDQPYGVPPYAVQTKDSLDTNDARILDAFELEGTIQWVSNTMDFNSGRSGVFHGVLHLPQLQDVATGHIIAHPTDYLGYPGLAWTGSDPSQQDAIIVVSHCSPTRHPGGSAFYSDGLGQYSDLVSIKEGTRSVDMLTGTVERWGDYVGIQRLYHQPGSVWISCSYGRQGNVNEAWIAKLARNEENVATHEISNEAASLKTYPNPSDEYVTIEIDNPEGKKITVQLFDASGHPVETLYDGAANYSGKAKLSFAMHTLPAGQYLVQVMLDGQLVVTKSVIKV